MTFGEKLNSMRKNSGFTQEEVAVRLGISPQAVSKWENDLSCPDIMLLPEIAKLYGNRLMSFWAQMILMKLMQKKVLLIIKYLSKMQKLKTAF